MQASVSVKHNIEVAHRLYETKGKCEAIHGHSMWVTLTLPGYIGANGMLINDTNGPLEFGAMKRAFRGYLDGSYDHHLLLNRNDPFAGQLIVVNDTNVLQRPERLHLPGLREQDGDPTTENIAVWIATWCAERFLSDVEVEVWETSVNQAKVSLSYEEVKKFLKITQS